MRDPSKIEVAVFIRDLIFETKITSTARSLGISTQVVRSLHELETLLNQSSIRLLIVDLNTGGTAAMDAVKSAKSHGDAASGGVRVLAFVSHVDADLAKLATEAGADEVVPRSRFAAQLPELLT